MPNKRLLEDVKQVCLWLVRGYPRRLKAHHEGRYNDEGHGKTTATGELERMKAVEQALVDVGADIDADEVREQLRIAVMLNVESGRRYPYEKLELSAVSRSDFYRRKNKFLKDIAVRLGMA